MRRLVILAAAALLAAGCGEDAAQHAARVAVQRQVGGSAKTRCTQTARQYVKLVETTIYICIVYRSDGRCDSYVATRRGRRFGVRLRRREVDCLLPTG